MKFKAKVEVEGDGEEIYKIFEPENKNFQNNRAKYSLNKKGNDVEFDIKAEDSTALRAVFNAITKNITIYEKAKWIKQPKKK